MITKALSFFSCDGEFDVDRAHSADKSAIHFHSNSCFFSCPDTSNKKQDLALLFIAVCKVYHIHDLQEIEECST